MDAAAFVIEKLAAKLKTVQGIQAIVLGGSRASGTHAEQSDIDIGLYYDPEVPIDLPALEQLASEVDDERRSGLITPIGEWGPWINGGGWLQVDGLAVDFLYRDLNKVNGVMADCLQGRVTIDYQPGHPHGFINAMYMAEAARCLPLWDPSGVITKLKSQTAPYPPELAAALIRTFLWEAGFSVSAACKGAAKQDVSYAAGCCFRAVSCLNQVLFALNGQYWMNEKGAVQLAGRFPVTITDYKSRINGVFTGLTSDPDELHAAIQTLETIVQETERLSGSISP
ncbi:nucleotidyltransferase domain-containing protein [Paenibacillus sp. NPDC056579]|uniref:nucleotidyltransferase domain-containing protein n=1 Tax=Paenibacillus sp. NPDC056579 TaxID=3345871 RepID=UPI003698D1CF